VIDPELVWMSSLWRTDCIAFTPNSVKYPNAFRGKVAQFLQDLRFALEDRIWCPGAMEDLERADSKPKMLATASRLGIPTPGYTSDAYFPPVATHQSSRQGWYRKNLGFPFTISFSQEGGVEVGVTTTNSLWNDASPPDDQPWQWQEAIESIAQIRTYLVGNDVWAALWRRTTLSEKFVGFRSINESSTGEIKWEPYCLPSDIQERTVALCKELKLTMAAPEFLVTKTGEHVLIDLNPCGDWLGFFSEQEHNEIASSIAISFDRMLSAPR
jgi:hypothetical protein